MDLLYLFIVVPHFSFVLPLARLILYFFVDYRIHLFITDVVRSRNPRTAICVAFDNRNRTCIFLEYHSNSSSALSCLPIRQNNLGAAIDSDCAAPEKEGCAETWHSYVIPFAHNVRPEGLYI